MLRLRSLLENPLFRSSFAFGLALAWCFSVLIFRTLWTWNLDYAFLIWNLGLATCPLMFAILFTATSSNMARVSFFLLWLLFLPNAPYIITDFIHLTDYHSGPLWLDIILLFSCALTGLAIGFYSLGKVHDHFAERSPRLGWMIVIATSFLCGFGIYLGRFLRWRSVDLFQRPGHLLQDILSRAFNPTEHPRAWGVTLAFGVLFTFGYAILRVFRAPSNASSISRQM